MNDRMIPMSELEPEAAELARAGRRYARYDSLDDLRRAAQASGSINAEVVVDLLDGGDPVMAAAALRMLVADGRASRARFAELDAATTEVAR